MDKYYTKEERKLLGDVLFCLYRGFELPGGGTRDFDILDYLMMANGCSLERLKEVGDIILTGIEDTKPIAKFVWENTDDEAMNDYIIKCLLESIDEVKCKKDKNGFPIPGTGIKIMPAEKRKLIEILKENDFPLTVSTYCAIKSRYVNGWPLEFKTYTDAEEKLSVQKKKIKKTP